MFYGMFYLLGVECKGIMDKMCRGLNCISEPNCMFSLYLYYLCFMVNWYDL